MVSSCEVVRYDTEHYCYAGVRLLKCSQKQTQRLTTQLLALPE
jgi:urease accessory protein UreF